MEDWQPATQRGQCTCLLQCGSPVLRELAKSPGPLQTVGSQEKSQHCLCYRQHLGMRANDEAVDIKGEANVETKDGTPKGSGLPCQAAQGSGNSPRSGK